MTLSPVAFGRELLVTGDLDPVYLALKGAHLDPGHRARWCFAYWLFYHTGVASRLSEVEGRSFWREARANLKTFPRGTERRHFRGANAELALEKLAAVYPKGPEQAVEWLTPDFQKVQAPGLPFASVRAQVLTWPQFGPWIAFKVADMLDAVLDIPVDFSRSMRFWFDDPKHGAHLVASWMEWHDIVTDFGSPEPTVEDLFSTAVEGMNNSGPDETLAVIETVAEFLTRRLWEIRPPHAPTRRLGVQEVETICCKYKSHLRGHYPVGKDSREVRHALEAVPSETARRLLPHVPKVPECAKS